MVSTRRENWLTLTKEPALEPDLPICDPHHHLWDNPGSRYLVDDLLKDINGNNVVKTIFVDCRTMYRTTGTPEMRPVGETEYVESISARTLKQANSRTAIAAGIVGYADLSLGTAVTSVLEAQIMAGKERFRGIRNMTTWDASPDIMSYTSLPRHLMAPKFREGFACLQKYDLSFDAWVYHTQLAEVVDLARAFPGTTIIMDHVGGPLGIGPYAGRHDEIFQAWQRSIAELATCPNVVVKVGGLAIASCGFDWYQRPVPMNSAELAKEIAPYYLWCIEKFGTDRCMLESNFPVDKRAYSYTVLWNAFKRLTKDFTPEERSALFYDTAMRVYRLSDRKGK